MKHFFSITLFALLLATTWVSCSKEKTDAPPAFVPQQLNEKLMTKTTLYYGNIQFEYYPDRKLKTFWYVSSGNETRYNYVYNGNKIIRTFMYNGILGDSSVFTLNEKGFATSLKYTDLDDNGNITYQTVTQYQYNPNGQVTRWDYGNGEHVEAFYDSKGNMTSFHSFNANGVKVSSSEYEYYTDKPNKFMSYGVSEVNGNGGILGYHSTNLLKRAKSGGPGNPTYDATYTYELDADGFILKGKSVNAVSGITEEWTNTYQ